MRPSQARLKDSDRELLAAGKHYELYKVMGARVAEGGVLFAVWAPNAKQISVVGDFNSWNETSHPMELIGKSGVWELFIPDLPEGASYKFWVDGQLKADPYAHWSEVRPRHASKVFDVARFQWSPWTRDGNLNRPINIYEAHLGSWGEGGYRELAPKIADYCIEMGYTHLELLPITEHPLDESWGYQVSGYFAPTSRYGTPEDFQFFVDHCHQKGLGVILDWVPGHFPDDEWALHRFDGEALYEHHDPELGHHPQWETKIFHFGKKEVDNFLIASALFWLDRMGVDGLRVDAVSSMIRLDFARENFTPNRDGGNVNLEAIAFLKHLNEVVHDRFPGTLMIAEESHAFPGVTAPAGLGFDLKWNLGWMHDIITYFQGGEECYLTFPQTYAYDDCHLLPFSHDEVVHEKGSLFEKMGSEKRLHLLLSFQMCQPGKKLLFMGGELGQRSEWDVKGALEWEREGSDTHQFVKELNHFYKAHPALWERDFAEDGFEWLIFGERFAAYWRKGEKERLLCVHNFGDGYHEFALPADLKQVFGEKGKFEGEHFLCPPETTAIFS